MTMPIDREKTCPFLIRLFWKENAYHDIEIFSEKGKEPVEDEVQIYTWKDATLRELVDLLKTSLPEAMKKDVKFKFSFIEQDLNGNYKREEIGTVHSVIKSKDDFITLRDKRFIIGDYIDLCLETSHQK